MGSDFIDAVSYHELSSPLTFERYTYSKNGSFMGWSVEQSQYGKYMKQRTDIKDLYSRAVGISGLRSCRGHGERLLSGEGNP
jgi:hypothetical protein